MQFIFVLFLTAAVALTKVSADLDEKKILGILFASCERPTLDVSQVKTKLESLRDLYGSESKKFISLQGVADQLAIIGLSEQADCYSDEAYAKFESLENSAKGHCNIAQYVEHFKQKYNDRCKEGLPKLYSTILNKVPETALNQLTKITNTVKSAYGDGFDSSRPFYDNAALINGIYNYLVELETGAKRSEGQIQDRGGVKIRKFRKLFGSKVEAICDQVGEEFKVVSRALLDRIANSPRVFAYFDDALKPSLYGASVCLDIADRDKSVRTLVFYKYYNNKPKSALVNFLRF